MIRGPVSEKPVQNAILAAVGGLPFVRLWRQNTGAAQYVDPATGQARWVRYGLPGAPDLTGLVRCGRRLEVEVKSATGRASPEQERYAAMARAFGALYVLARSVDDVTAALASHASTCRTCALSSVYTPASPVGG